MTEGVDAPNLVRCRRKVEAIVVQAGISPCPNHPLSCRTIAELVEERQAAPRGGLDETVCLVAEEARVVATIEDRTQIGRTIVLVSDEEAAGRITRVVKPHALDSTLPGCDLDGRAHA